MKKFVCLLLALVLLVSVIPMAALATEETVSNEMAVTSVTLRTMEGKEGMFYNANFCLSAESIAALQADTSSCYGLALSTTYLPNQAAWTDGLNRAAGAAKVLRSTYAFHSNPLTADVNKKVNSTSLVNIININNDGMTNQRNGATVVYVRPYYQVDGQFTFGAVQACSMQDVAEMVDDYYNETKNGAPYLNDTQKKGLLGMYERFYSLMTKWDMPTLSADYEAGNELILQYRREKVVANMQAQQEILWTIDSNEPISYSRVPSSQGDRQDELNGSQYAGELYTFYPGRIYRGIPYTHASSGLDIYYTMAGGSANEDGVYVLQGLNRSFLNSSPDNGALGMLNSLGEAVGQYRVARMGNDCWDAISWAYESIGADIDADQTDQLTPYFGMYPVGNYDFDVFVDTNNTHKDDGEISHEINTYFKGQPEYDKINRIYDAYAQMKPGDTLVNDTHALLCTGVEVVYTPSTSGAYVKDADGNFVYEGRNYGSDRYDIDVANSYIYFLEQASGDEEAQSHEDSYFTETLDSHNAGSCAADACKYCAGYDAEAGVWDLATQKYVWSFENMLKNEHYIPVRPAILNDATVKPLTVRISDSLSTEDSSNVTKLFDGELASNNRISQVTLNIYQNGDLVNSATCFGTQSDLTGTFKLSRFTTDAYAGAFGSVLYGTPGLIRQAYYTAQYAQKLDENGNLLDTTVAKGKPLYIYEQLTDAEGNPVYKEGVLDINDNPIPVMIPVRNAYGNTVYTKATVATPVPDYEKLQADAFVIEADPDILSAGEYYYEMTCQLANGRKITFRSGSFLVSETLTEAGNYTVTAN